MTQTLQDVTLTMIVRDELMNPAGGLLPMLEYHLPHFPEAVVLDTGSVDGTRQLLEEMRREYPQLGVYDATFEGYGPARNTANGYVKTKYTLMLDADEMISEPKLFSVEVNTGLEQQHQEEAYNITLKTLFPSGSIGLGGGFRTRLFFQKSAVFVEDVWEKVLINGRNVMSESSISTRQLPEIASPINHFTVSGKDWNIKREDWHLLFETESRRYALGISAPNGRAPSQIPSYPVWKTPNPSVLRKYGIKVLQEIEYLEGLGLQIHPGIVERLSQDNVHTSQQ